MAFRSCSSATGWMSSTPCATASPSCVMDRQWPSARWRAFQSWIWSPPCLAKSCRCCKAGPDASMPEVLGVQHLRSGTRVKDASVTVRRGEIVGLGGLLGSGRTELARAVFGADAVDAGQIRIKGELVKLDEPADAIARGVAFLSEDRKTEGIIADLSI